MMQDETPLNPVLVESQIRQLSNDIAKGIPIVSNAEKAMVDAKRHLDREVAQATLVATGTVMDRQARVELDTQPAREEYDIAYLAYRHAERTAKSLESRLRVIQSIGASVRAMYSVAVRERADEACEAMVAGVCVGSVEQLHHRRLRSQGGEHTVENLAAVCSPCHTRFHREVAEAVLHGWIVRSVNDPVDVPMMYRGALGFLTAGGGVVLV